MGQIYGIEKAEFNTWPITKRLEHVTGIKWMRMFNKDKNLTVYKPRAEKHKHKVTITNRMNWNLITQEGRKQSLGLCYLYADIRRALGLLSDCRKAMEEKPYDH